MSTMRRMEGQATRAATQHAASVCERAYREGAMKPWLRGTSSGVHKGCTRLARHAVHSHPADTDLWPFPGACTTEDYPAQRRFLPYKQEVTGSSPVPPTEIEPGTTVDLRVASVSDGQDRNLVPAFR
jgi:hypothetical protein